MLEDIARAKDHALSKIEEVYITDDPMYIYVLGDIVEGEKYVREEINRFKAQLQQKIKEVNGLSFERKEYQNHLDNFKKQLSIIESKLEPSVEMSDKIAQMKQESEEC